MRNAYHVPSVLRTRPEAGDISPESEGHWPARVAGASFRFLGAMVKYLIALVVALLLNAGANLCIKFGMKAIAADLAQAGTAPSVTTWVRLLLRHWIVLVGLASFAANVAFYAYALQKLPISVAYPIMVVTGFAIIAVVAGMVLHERLTLAQWLGVAAILLGAFLVAKDAGRQVG